MTLIHPDYERLALHLKMLIYMVNNSYQIDINYYSVYINYVYNYVFIQSG